MIDVACDPRKVASIALVQKFPLVIVVAFDEFPLCRQRASTPNQRAEPHLLPAGHGCHTIPNP